ncbi:19754_t:CDS:2 [Entrophospora sp. SA101]|nr:15376_t:CDS:2 [Entrophospora sp. SA101]CAJ0764009.1 19754_t:CDS:2 [Entrophospora sp. SA101]CAJ0880899.1 3123_t:CDS:2 [Entrophospora sp. SA101]
MVNVLIKHGKEIKFGWEGFPIYHKQTLEDSFSSNSNMKRCFTELEEDSENDPLFSDYDESIENQSELFEKMTMMFLTMMMF